LPPATALLAVSMGVTFPFFVLVSAMGVLISLVAIPLRENVPIPSVNSGSVSPGIRLEIPPRTNRLEAPAKDFKLLKFLILRVVLQLFELYHKSAFSGHREMGRID
jgi:hypothetical protein